MGVFATSTVTEGVTFGPVVPAITLTEPAALIGHMTCDTRPKIHTVKVDIQDYREGSRLSEWTPYVQAARDEREQTLEAVVKEGQLYYRTARIIRPGDELLVWYSKDYAHMLGIPELESYHVQESGEFRCQSCSKTFLFPHSLRAHMRFKCEQRHLLWGRALPDRALPDNAHFVHSSEPSRSNCSGNQSRSPEKRKLESPESEEVEPKKVMTYTIPDVNCNVHESLKEREGGDIGNGGSGGSGGSAFSKVEKAPRLPLFGQASFLQSLINKTGMGPDEKASMEALVSIYNRHPPGLMGTGPYLTKMTDIHNIENANPQYKMTAHGVGSNILPYYRSQNPMVEKLIQSALHVAPSNVNHLNSLAMNQNWCAKCNASFRMTSDLVYHMRSHHSPAHDISKRKRDEKLKCNVCGETFRERHHLTRHMTSHQDM